MLEQSPSSRNGDSVYSEQEEHVTESRRTCSSTDSGRSSISSSQASHCDEPVDKNALSKDIDQLLSSDKSQSKKNEETETPRTEVVEDLDMYADVTLIPKSINTIILHPKETKVHAKRTSRPKSGKSSKARKTTTSTKMADSNDPLFKDTVSETECLKLASKNQKSVTNKEQEEDALVSTSTTVMKPESAKLISHVMCESKSLNKNDVKLSQKSIQSTVSVSPTSNEPKSDTRISDQASSLEENLDAHNTDKILLDDMNHHSGKSSMMFSGSLTEDKKTYSEEKDQCEGVASVSTQQPDTTDQDNSLTITASGSPKYAPFSNTRAAQPCVEVEKSELKFCSYSSSSSPIPNSGNKLRTPLASKRRSRLGGSPVSTGNASTGKSHFTQRPSKSLAIRPLMPVELENHHSLSSINSRKSWSDRNKRGIQNTALLPNPLFQSSNCLCVQQHVDTSNLLLNQPLCWLLPGLHFNQYTQSTDTGLRNLGADTKPPVPRFSPMIQADGSALLSTTWQSAKYQAQSPYVGADCGSANLISAAQLCNTLSGMQVQDNTKPSFGKQYCIQRAQPNTKCQTSDLPSVSVQTEELINNSSDTSFSLDANAHSDRSTNKGDVKANGATEADDAGKPHNLSCSTDSAKTRAIITTGGTVRQGASGTGAGTVVGQESQDISRSFVPGSSVSDSSTASQIVSNVVAYNNVGEPCVMPANFVYVYSADGQLFAIPSTAMVYPTQASMPNTELGSGSDSAYSSPPAVLSAQAVQEANFHPAYTTTNFDIPTGLLGAGQELSLESANTLTPFYEPVSSNQLTLTGNVSSGYHPEANQWSGCTIPLGTEHSSALLPSSQNQTQIRPILISSQNANLIMQNAYVLNGQYLTGSAATHQTHTTMNNSVDHGGKEALTTQSNSYTRTSQNNQSIKTPDNPRHSKQSFETPSGLLGHAKTSGSILGDSKSMVLHPMPGFMEDMGRTGSTSQSGHNRQKKHSSKTNLYIRGLPATFTEEQLHTLAPDKDLIRSVKLISGTEGEMYGFIDFMSNVAARAALLHIKSTNRELYVNFAYESEKDPQNVYITNIPETWTASNVEDLKKIFQPYGQIATAIVMTKRSNNFCTGAGFVRFVRAEDAQRAIEGIRIAQVKLEGGKGPLEVKLADRQKPADDQSSTSKSRTSKPLSESSNVHSSDGASETQAESFRHSGQSSVKKPSGCLLTGESVAPLLGLAMNSVNSGQRNASSVQVGTGLLPGAANFNMLCRMNNSNSFAMALQNALANTSAVNSNLLLQNSLSAMNFPIPISNDSQAVTQLPYRAQTSQMTNFLPQPRGPRINTGLLQHPPLPASTLYSNQAGMIPLVRGPVEELTYNPPSIGLSGAHTQSAILGHTLQSNGTWTTSTLIPGMFAPM